MITGWRYWFRRYLGWIPIQPCIACRLSDELKEERAMCKFASFVLTKDRVFWLPDSDSHSEVIARHKIHESGARGLNIVKVWLD